MKKVLVLSLVVFAGSLVFWRAQAGTLKPSVIYGKDNRQDVYEVKDPTIRDIADSTVAMIEHSMITPGNKNKMSIDPETFGSSAHLCSDEPFYSQPNAALCSGALIGDDLILTAGHCVETARDCKDNAFVFNYRMQDAQTAPNEVDADEVYSCAKIVTRELSGNHDYAVIQLDRKVRGHRVLKLSAKSVVKGEDIYVIGHPAGLPTKVADDARVRRATPDYFVTNLDTYGGNSGSAVFSSRTNEIVGILVRGSNDFVYDSARACNHSNICTEKGCRGEEVTDISQVNRALQTIY